MDHLAEQDTTKAEILRAAQELFVRQGYHGTSMRQIASQAGIALGGIYNHFSGKEAIFRELFMQLHPYREVLPVVEHAADESFEALVREAAARMVTVLDRRPDFINLVMIEIVEFNSRHLGEIFMTVYPEVLAGLQRLLRTDENLRPIPVPIMLRVFIGLFFSYYISEKILGSIAVPAFTENAMDYFVDVFLHGILKPASAES